MKLGIVEFRYVLDALLDIGIQHRILFLQQPKIVLVHHSHVHVLEKQHIIDVLKSADAKNRQNAHPVRPEVVHDVPDVLGEPGACTGDAGHHDGYGDIVGLAFFFIVADGRLLGLSQGRPQRDG